MSAFACCRRPVRTTGVYRQYPPEAADRVRVIRRALGLGFSLNELTRILRVRDAGGAPCRQVHALAIEKLAQLDVRISDLLALRTQSQTVVAQWGGQLDSAPEGKRVGLLEG